MERRTVDGVDKQHDAQRARSRASGAESNPTNTTARASGGSWRARGWRSEGVVWREGRVGPGCEFVVFSDETRANFGTIDHGAPPQARMPLPQLGSHPLQEVRKSNGRPLRTPLNAKRRYRYSEPDPTNHPPEIPKFISGEYEMSAGDEHATEAA